MAEGMCDICGFRPAAARIAVERNGRRKIFDVCAVDLTRIQQGSYLSPLESLFASEGYYGNFSPEEEPSRGREMVDLGQFLSEHTKELLQQAAEVAAKFGRREIDTEHVLYALCDAPVIQEVLRQFRVSPQEIREFLDAAAPHGEGGTAESFSISPRVKHLLGLAWESAQELGHSYVGPEHLLIGLAEEDEGMAGELLRKYGLTREPLRQKVLKVVGRGAQEGRVEAKSTTPQLDKYSRDLSKLARCGKLDPVVGRVGEIESVIEILSRRTKNNPVLIGEPGVGKTAIVEGLAQRITQGDVPEMLREKRVVELSTNAMVAGSRYRGEFEERIKVVLDEVVAHQDELILFIDELHTIVGAGAAEGGLDVSNVLKPSLARGELHLIGATTLGEYQKHIEKDAALERRFQPVIVPEPTVEQAIEILRGLRDRYEAHHKVRITDEALVAAAELSDRYIPARFLPDKAIDLVDQASARVRIALGRQSPTMRELEEELGRLQREREYATQHKEYAEAAELEEKSREKQVALEVEREKWRQEKGVTSGEVRPEQIAEVVAKLTGIPVTELTQKERDRLLKLEERLHERVIGQEEAIRAVSDAVRRARSGLSERNRPIATFLFLGPTGVGKTELAKTLAEVVFGDENAVTRLDMSEYLERHAAARLIGAPPGYVGYEEGGQLTEAVRRRPYSIILLDEIEKAHPEVYNVLLQLLDEGRLTDGKGRVVSFTNTIIIATSNLGTSGTGAPIGFLAEAGEDRRERDRLFREIRNHFRPEFVNRLDEIIIFHPLEPEQIRQIVRMQLERVARTARGQGITLSFDESLITHLAETGYAPEYGARELRRRIQSEVENTLARQMLSSEIKEGEELRVGYNPEQGVLFTSGMSKKPAASSRIKRREKVLSR